MDLTPSKLKRLYFEYVNSDILYILEPQQDFEDSWISYLSSFQVASSLPYPQDEDAIHNWVVDLLSKHAGKTSIRFDDLRSGMDSQRFGWFFEFLSMSHRGAVLIPDKTLESINLTDDYELMNPRSYLKAALDLYKEFTYCDKDEDKIYRLLSSIRKSDRVLFFKFFNGSLKSDLDRIGLSVYTIRGMIDHKNFAIGH